MTTCYFETLAAFAVSCLLSAMIIPKISLIAFRRRLFDPLDDRKLHTTHIPRLGGIAFFRVSLCPFRSSLPAIISVQTAIYSVGNNPLVCSPYSAASSCSI